MRIIASFVEGLLKTQSRTGKAPAASRSPFAPQSEPISETTAHGETFEAELPHFEVFLCTWAMEQ